MKRTTAWISLLILIPVFTYSQGTPKVIRLGVKTNETEKYGRMPLGAKVAVFCRNTQSLKGKISTLRFYIGKDGFYKAPFKVHMYTLNAADSTPGQDMILDNLVVSADKSGWLEVNVTKYGIDIPANGFFVAMEWIFTKSDYTQKDTTYSSNEEQFTSHGYGQTIGTITDSPDLGSLTYFKNLGGHRWGRFMLPDMDGKSHVINALIQAEVSVN